MAESIFMRVRRVISASIEDAVDAMERAGGTSVMREAVREVDRAMDAATARKLQAMRQQRMFRDQLAAFGEKARFAMTENRDDLAEAAISRQLDFEVQAERLDKVQTDAASAAARLDECLSALSTRKQQMEEALAAFEAARRDASLGGEGPARPERHTERKVAQAEQAFDRAMAGAGGVTGFTSADAETVQKVAELATLQRSAVIAERMAALRSAQKAG